MKINTATKITIVRVLLIPIILIILLLANKLNLDKIVTIFGVDVYLAYIVALMIYVIAALSDAVDGYIARSTNTITNLGKFLDPIADKLLVNSLLIYFCSTNHLPALVVILMISRDVLVDALRLICVENNVVIAASKWGKLKTIFQMISLGLIFVFAQPGTSLVAWLEYLIYLTTLISVLSGVDYFIKNMKSLFN